MNTENPYLPTATIPPAKSVRGNRSWLLHECAFWFGGMLGLLQLALMAYRLFFWIQKSSQPSPVNLQLMAVLLLLGISGLAYLAPRWYFRRSRRDLLALGVLVLAIAGGHSLLI